MSSFRSVRGLRQRILVRGTDNQKSVLQLELEGSQFHAQLYSGVFLAYVSSDLIRGYVPQERRQFCTISQTVLERRQVQPRVNVKVQRLSLGTREEQHAQVLMLLSAE